MTLTSNAKRMDEKVDERVDEQDMSPKNPEEASVVTQNKKLCFTRFMKLTLSFTFSLFSSKKEVVFLDVLRQFLHDYCC